MCDGNHGRRPQRVRAIALRPLLGGPRLRLCIDRKKGLVEGLAQSTRARPTGIDARSFEALPALDIGGFVDRRSHAARLMIRRSGSESGLLVRAHLDR